MKYEVYNCREDERESLHCTFNADSDEEAFKKFEKYKHDKSLAWDYLTLIKVV